MVTEIKNLIKNGEKINVEFKLAKKNIFESVCAFLNRNGGYINVFDFVPFPKNSIISKFFSEIGLADELGSGIRKL